MHSDTSQFSERQKEVIGLLLEGKSNKQIALALGISASAVEYHLKNIYKKLQISSRTEAVLRLGKSINGDSVTELGKPIVEIKAESAENGGKSVSRRRFPVNKMFYLFGTGLLLTAAVGVIILTTVPRQTGDVAPTMQASSPPVYTATPTVNLGEMETETPAPNPISITKAIETEDGYILMGEFIPLPDSVLSDGCCSLELLDGSGKLIVEENTWGLDPGTPTANIPFSFTWVKKFQKQNLALPVTVKAADRHWTSFTVPFEFDAGDNPQPGDEWPVYQPLEVGGMTATLETIRVIRSELPASGGGYAFLVTYPFDRIYLDSVSIEGYPPPINAGFGGGGSSSEPEPTMAGMNYSVEFSSLPKGKLTVELTFMIGFDDQQWSLPWQP